jgi:hypothetical protein
MVSAAVRAGTDQDQAPKRGLLGMLSRGNGHADVFAMRPMLVVGDIDETTIKDIFGLLRKEGDEGAVSDRILQIDYKPLALGGAGNVPLYAEFFTRGLLALPPAPNKDGAQPWQAARTYLIDSCGTDGMNTPRLVFYVFSVGGGTGAGSAAEIMRAQRFAMATSAQADPQIYFTGVGIIPADLQTNATHLINAGRTVIQYLAELNLRLETNLDYTRAPSFTAANFAPTPSATGRKPMMPWDGFAFVSNDVMMSTEGGFEQAETNANQYIAQQMFNLAASQISVESYVDGNHEKVTKRNFQSVRLDPQDLRTGVVGPYAVCFSAADADEILKDGGIDRMFIRAISLPQVAKIQRYDQSRMVEGISITPEDKAQYAQKIAAIATRMNSDGKIMDESAQHRLSSDAFLELRTIPLFSQCQTACPCEIRCAIRRATAARHE